MLSSLNLVYFCKLALEICLSKLNGNSGRMGWEKVEIFKTEQKIRHHWNICWQAWGSRDLTSSQAECADWRQFCQKTQMAHCVLPGYHLFWLQIISPITTDGKTGFGESGHVHFLFCISPITLFGGVVPNVMFIPKSPLKLLYHQVVLKPFALP